MAVGIWQVLGGMWPNCLGAVRKAGIRCPRQLVVGGEIPDIVAGGAGAREISTFYVLISIRQALLTVPQGE